MKSKILAIIMVILVGYTLINAKNSIKDIEYLKGDDFVQLYFKTNQMIPIPYVFHPIKDNPKFIVMRINDIDFINSKNTYKFDSPIVDNLNIKKSKQCVEVEILLKEEVKYRVFTNQNGLYIEFPELSNATIPAIPKPAKTQNPINIYKNDKIKTNWPAGKNGIKNIQVREGSEDFVQINLHLLKPVDYKVIPITKYPYRLAIDLKNTKGKKINKYINQANVKALRGAYNSPEVFRLVFDLNQLKDYDVALKGNILQVQFGQKALAQSTKPAAKEMVAKAQTKKPISKPEVKETKKETNPIKIAPPKEDQPKLTLAPDKSASKPAATKKTPEFFSEEKSKVAKENLERSYITRQEEDGTQQTTYLIQTLDSGETQYSGEPVTFKFFNMDLKNVLLTFAKLANLSIVLDPGVSGKITCEMYDIPWDQALHYFLKINNLDMVKDGRLLRVGRVDVLAAEAERRRKLREARQMEGNLTLATRVLSYVKVGDIVGLLKNQLTPRGNIQTDERSNTLIISEVPEKIKLLDKLIDTLDVANPQVSIEARIVESNSTYVKNLGIQWGYNLHADGRHGNQTTLKFPNSISIYGDQIYNRQNPGIVGELGGYAINLPAPGRTVGTVFSLGNVANTFKLETALTAMQQKGKGRIISSPKTTTQNNMKAEIMQGRQIPVQMVQNNTVTVRFVPAALSLSVTPQITARGTIITSIDIKNNSADFANTVNGIPPIITQSIQTTVMIEDGGTIVIGGIYRVEQTEQEDSVPLLSKIPLLGNLFKSSSKRGEQKELLVFITPRIIK